MSKKQILHIAMGTAAIVLGVIMSATSDASSSFVRQHGHWAMIILALATNLKTILEAATPNINGIMPALAVFIGLALGSCAHVPAPSADCKTAALALLGTVSSAAVQAEWMAALDALLTDPHADVCAVEEAAQIIEHLSADDSTRTGDPLQTQKAAHLKAWLLTKGIQ